MSGILNVVLCQKGAKLKISLVEGKDVEMLRCISTDSEKHLVALFVGLFHSSLPSLFKKQYSEIHVLNRHRFSQEKNCIANTSCKGLSKQTVKAIEHHVREHLKIHQNKELATS